MRTTQIDRRRQPGYFPYYKLQYWLERERAWHDIQRRFPTPEAARDHIRRSPHRRYRLMQIQREGRRLYGEVGAGR